jgi:hypothetical protein
MHRNRCHGGEKENAGQIASGDGASYTQNVLALSVLTYECTQCMSCTALPESTTRQVLTPSSLTGMPDVLLMQGSSARKWLSRAAAR